MPKMEIRAEGPEIPTCMAWHVRRALRWMPQVDLVGVETIRLFEKDPAQNPKTGEMVSPDPNVPPFYLGGKSRWGFYASQYMKKSPYIGLNVEALLAGLPGLFKYSPIATYRIARVLAHEVAHHLVRTRGYIFNPHESYDARVDDPKHESMAELYAIKVNSKLRKGISFKLVRAISNMLGGFYYALASAALDKRQYRRAAYYFFCAFHLYEDNNDALHGWQYSVSKVRESDQTAKVKQPVVYTSGTSRQRAIRRRRG